MLSKQQESLYKCQQLQHNGEFALYLCTKPECTQEPVCCQVCVKDYHQQHMVEQFISINDIEKIETINMNQTCEKIKELEKKLISIMKEIKNILDKMDILKQLNAQPSKILLKKISLLHKSQINYKQLHNEEDFYINIINQNFSSLKDLYEKQLRDNQDYFNKIAQENYQKGDDQCRIKKYEQGSIYFDKALEMNDEHLQALVSKGASLLMLKKYEEAIQYADKALNIEQNQQNALFTKAASLRMLKRYDEAIQYCDRLITIDPKDQDAYYTKSASLFRLNRNQEALTQISKTLEINQNHQNAKNLQQLILQTINLEN